MIKKTLWSVLLVFILWSVFDFVIHGLILAPLYEETAHLWRPADEMKILHIHTAVLLSALAFTAIYAGLIKDKRPGTGLAYGFLWGAAHGFSMGFCTYAVQPIPFEMAVIWMLGTLVQSAVAGLLLGITIKE